MQRVVQSLIYLLVFLTGATGLVYQVVWQRYLARLLGSDSTATAIILAVFLGGLSAGYWFCGKLTTRLHNCFRGYAILEGVIGIWVLVFPGLFSLVHSMTSSWSFAPLLPMLFQGVFCTVLLTGIPTFCMGGTIPMLTQAISGSVRTATRTHAWIYGMNTAGAFLGALLTGFYFIAAFGLPGTLRRTALINLAATVFFLLLPSRETTELAQLEETGLILKRPISPLARRFMYAIAFLSGAYVMILENVLIRITNLSLGSSSYSFSLIVAVFVLCIAIGSLIVGRLGKIPSWLLFANQTAIAIFLLILFLVLDNAPYAAHRIRICFQSNVAGFWFYQAIVLLFLFLVLLLPVSLIGATLPLLFHELKKDLADVGKHSGLLFSWNALGCILGSLCGGILFYFFLNHDGIYLVAIGLALISAALATWPMEKPYRIAGAALLVGALFLPLLEPGYQERRFAMGTFRIATPEAFSFHGSKTFFEQFYAHRKIRFYSDGPAGTVSVIESDQLSNGPASAPDIPFPMPNMPGLNSNSGNTSLAIMVNGKSDSNVEHDKETLKLSAHLPALWAEKRTKVMIIGLGTGVTAAEAALYPDVETIEIAEISPTVIEALPQFYKATRNVHKDPRLKIHCGDAFRILGRSREQWNIIVSEPSNPWVTGVDQLFSREFYKLAKSRLAANGLLLQWIHQYALSTEAFGIVLNTVRSEFKSVALFRGTKGDLLILASNKSFSADAINKIDSIISQNETLRNSMAEIQIFSASDLLKRERSALSAIANQFTRFGIETLDKPRLHYLAGKTFFTGEEMGSETTPLFGGSGIIISRQALE